MSFLMLYPAVAVLALCVMSVVIVMLRYGARWCGLRHVTLGEGDDWSESYAFEQKVSYA